MRNLLLAIPALSLSACMMMPPPQGGSSPSSAQSPEPGAGAMSEPGVPAGGESTDEPKNNTSVPTSIEVHSDCPQTLPLFIGEKPKFGSGTKTSIGSNTTTTFPRKSDGTQTIWIIDESENGIASASVSADTKRVEIDRNCTGISAR
jgi:hypothetical protein